MPPSTGPQAYPRSAPLTRLSFQDTIAAQLKLHKAKKLVLFDADVCISRMLQSIDHTAAGSSAG